jgi:hypothetical protein
MCLDDTTWFTTTFVGDVESIQLQHQYLANQTQNKDLHAQSRLVSHSGLGPSDRNLCGCKGHDSK